MKNMSPKLKVGDFVVHFIDTEIHRFGTVVETGIMYDYVKVCWVTTDLWPVSTKDFYEDETREILLERLDSPEDIERLKI